MSGSTEYQHAEAYCHMQYRCTNGHIAIIWNSRDGVTPFMMRCRECEAEAQHINWQQDHCDPLYQPRPGDLMWVTMTLEDARVLARAQVEKNWNHPDYPMSAVYADKAEAVERLAKGYCDPPGQPRLTVMGGAENPPPGGPRPPEPMGRRHA